MSHPYTFLRSAYCTYEETILGFLRFSVILYLFIYFQKETPQLLSAITSLLPSICIHVTKTRRLNQCTFAETFPVYGINSWQ